MGEVRCSLLGGIRLQLLGLGKASCCRWLVLGGASCRWWLRRQLGALSSSPSQLCETVGYSRAGQLRGRGALVARLEC